MEELVFLYPDQLKFVYKHKDYLENHYSVQISVPPADDFESALKTNDLFFANLIGSESDIQSVKAEIGVLSTLDLRSQGSSYRNRKEIKQNYGKVFEVAVKKKKRKVIEKKEKEIEVITLSDSDTETTSEEVKNKKCSKKRKHSVEEIDPTSRLSAKNEVWHNTIDLTTPTASKNRVQCNTIDLTAPIASKNRVQCEVISTTIEPKKKLQKNCAEEFIPLLRFSKNSYHSDHQNKESSSNDGCSSNHQNKASSSKEKASLTPAKVLRPVVIDGSNIAREHGKKDHCFSSKGIKISVDYFLKRGHTDVTALVPHWRKYCTSGRIPTTDKDLLEELENSGHVTFTPSRTLNNKRLTPYDDRFIVNLATTNGGVILSNDNYKDLMAENEAFKKTIEERLLMFCFVGDILLIPEDPLGRDGPSLGEFLSFPALNTIP